MHINSYNDIVNSNIMKSVRKNKYYLGENHLNTEHVNYFHVLILFFHNELSDRRIETIRKKLIAQKTSHGESLDTPQIIKFYGKVKQLIIS